MESILGGLDLNLVRVFDAIYRTGTVSEASRRLRQGQPATSAALGRLRAAFDDPLFVRSQGRMRPTELAEAIAPRLADAIACIESAMARARNFDPRSSKTPCVFGSTDYVTMVLGPLLMCSLSQQAPQADLRLLEYFKPEVAQLLERGDCDLALGVFPGWSDRIRSEPLFEDGFVGVARSGQAPSAQRVGTKYRRVLFVWSD